MTSPAAVPWRWRRDLICQRLCVGKFAQWVVRDPLSRQFFYFSDQELAILRQLDGSRSWAQWIADNQPRIAVSQADSDTPTAADNLTAAEDRPSDTVDFAEELLAFVDQARRKGLVTAVAEPLAGTRRGADSGAPTRVRWWHQPLAIRLPGWDPTALLAMVSGTYFFHTPCPGRDSRSVYRWCWVGVIALWLLAAAVALSHTAEIVGQVGRLASGGLPQQILVMAGLLAAVKWVHELAHAATCRWLGGQCREVGIMLLMGVPCLYCDVSDAWTMPRRWQRMLVSAAGMIAEMTVAALALLCWSLMTPGWWRDAALLVALLGSVSTLLVNGNPLMRYDGYYLLADWLRVPNLSAESTAALRDWLRRGLWGSASPLPAAETLPAPRWQLVGYALTSTAYRLVVLSAIFMLIYHLTAGQGLIWVPLLAAVAVLLPSQLRWWRSILRPPTDPPANATTSDQNGDANDDPTGSCASRSRWIRWTVLAAVLIGWLVPLPCTVTAPLTIAPADEQPLYVTTSGQLVQAVADGSQVVAGQPIASLANVSLQRKLAELHTEQATLQSRIQSLHTQSISQRSGQAGTAGGLGAMAVAGSLSAQLEALQAAAATVQQQIDWQQQQQNGLQLVAGRSGRFYAAPPSSQAAAVPDAMMPSGSHFQRLGAPLEPANYGATLAVGTWVGSVADPIRREAILRVPQQSIALVQIGQTVRLVRDDFTGSAGLSGTVVEITTQAVTTVGDQPQAVSPSPDAAGAADPTDRIYAVRVSLTPSPRPSSDAALAATLPARGGGWAKIRVQPMSLHQRAVRSFKQVFART